MQAVDNQSGQIARRGNDISQPGINRTAWHGIELGGGRVLNKRQATMVADRQKAQGAIRAHAGKNDADGPFTPVFGQAGQE